MHQPRAPGSAVEYGTNPIRNTAVFSLLEQAEKVLSTVLSGAPDANLAFDDLRRLHLTLTPQSGSAETYGANCVTSMSAKYEILIYWSEEDHAYLAEVPELPGCMADGDSYQTALENAEVIIQEWLETAEELGRPIPQPRGKLMYA